MHDPKGLGRPLLKAKNEQGAFECLLFADGSLSIVCEGTTLGSWPACERSECLKTLGAMAGIDDPVTNLSMLFIRRGR